jgi:hypothetical protein
MKEHLAEHSFRNLKFKCEDCDFLAEDNLSLEVHAGKAHSGNFECALCGFTGKDISDLDTHLHTCETFTCRYCLPAEETFSMISDVKTHLSNKHPKHIKHTDIEHIQMDRKTVNKYQKKYLEVHISFKLNSTSTELKLGPGENRHLCLSGDPCDSH